MPSEPDEAKIDAATAAHERYDKTTTDDKRKKLRDAEDALSHEEMQIYLANYNNRLARRRSEEAEHQSIVSAPEAISETTEID